MQKGFTKIYILFGILIIITIILFAPIPYFSTPICMACIGPGECPSCPNGQWILTPSISSILYGRFLFIYQRGLIPTLNNWDVIFDIKWWKEIINILINNQPLYPEY